MASSSLAVSTVAAAALSFVTSIFTRDPLLAFGGFTLFWAFIFVPTYHVNDATVDTLIVLAASALYAVMGAATSKLFDIGQLIDVWLSGSGGGPNAREELNIPFLLVGVIAAFFATFFGVAASRAGAATDLFWAGLVDLDETLAILLALLLGIVALAAIIVSVKQEKLGARFRGIHDWASVIYLFVWLVAIAAGAVPWYVCSPDLNYALAACSSMSDSARGWLAGVVGGVALLVGLGVGYWYERFRDKNFDYVTVERRSIYTRQGRFYSAGDALGTPWLVARFFFVVALYAATWVVGGYAQQAARGSQPVVDLFWSDGLAVFAVVTIVVFVAIYAAILVCYKWPRQFLGADEDERDRRRGEEALLQPGRVDEFEGKQPPSPQPDVRVASSESRRRTVPSDVGSRLSGLRFS